MVWVRLGGDGDEYVQEDDPGNPGENGKAHGMAVG